MFQERNRIFILIIVFVLFVNAHTFSENPKRSSVVFKGMVTEIAQKSITIGRTTIALPKEVKFLDATGNPIRSEMIKKGDYVTVEVDEGRVVIKRSPGIIKSESERDIPQ